MTAIVELKNATKIVKNGFDEEKIILNDVSLDIYEHDFITILGGNGAGKSTLFNSIAGTLPLTSGTIRIMGEDVTHFSPEKRAKYLSRVFQDPKMGDSSTYDSRRKPFDCQVPWRKTWFISKKTLSI